MTTGAYDTVNTVSPQMGEFPLWFNLRTTSTKSWQGANQAKVSLPPKTKITWFDEVPDKFRPGQTFWQRKDRWVKYGFPAQRKILEPHPYTMTLKNRVEDDYRLHSDNVVGDVWYYTDRTGFTFSDPWSSNDDLRILDKLRDHIAGSGFNAGVTSAESLKTIKMIAHRARTLRKSLVDFTSGHRRSAAERLATTRSLQRRASREMRVSQPTSSAWLELQYGWRPLVQDVYDGARFLGHYHGSHPVTNVYTVSRQVGGNPGVIQDGHLRYHGSYELFTDLVVRSSRSYRIEVKEVNYPSLAGLQDPASVLWELTPYSFVADWFIPIGSFLQARSLLSSIKLGNVVKTKFLRLSSGSVHLRRYTVGLDEKFSISKAPTKYRHLEIEMTREINPVLSVPLPSVKPLADAASWQHGANAVALLVNFFKR